MRHYENLVIVKPTLTEEEIKVTLLPPSDVWLSAEEALGLGICDYISDLKQN